MTKQPIERYLRTAEALPTGMLVRGSPLTREQLTRDADRTARRFTYQGTPCHGVSAEFALDDNDVDRLLQEGRVRTREFVARIPATDLIADGFGLLPTFGTPHQTIVALRAPGATLDRLLELALRDVLRNGYHRRWMEDR